MAPARAMRILACTAAALALAVMCAACGSESEQTSDAPVAPEEDWAAASLLDRLPGPATGLSAMDVALAKRQLGVAADLDPRDFRDRQGTGTPEARFDAAVLRTLYYLDQVRPTPLTKAIDHSAITAFASATVPDTESISLRIFRLDQSPEAIRRGLLKAGLKPVTDTIYALSDQDATDTYMGLGDDGIVVAGGAAADVADVLRRTKPDPRLAPMRRMIDTPRGALRIVNDYVDKPYEAADCVRRISGGQLFAPGNDPEDLVLELSGEPRASNVVLGTPATRNDQFLMNYRVDDVQRSGQLLTLKLRTTPEAGVAESAHDVADLRGALDLIYRCPGPVAAAGRETANAARAKQPRPTPPDRSGSGPETAISGFIGAATKAPAPAIKVRCPLKQVPRSTKLLRCTGTRRRSGRLYHYKIRVTVAFPHYDAIAVSSTDDATGEIVPKRSKRTTFKRG